MFKVKLEGGPRDGETFWITDMERSMAPFVMFRSDCEQFEYKLNRHGDESEDFVIFYAVQSVPPKSNIQIIGEKGVELISVNQSGDPMFRIKDAEWG